MRVTLGIPTLGDVNGSLYASHLALAASMGSKVDAMIVPSVFGISPHSRAREVVIEKAIDFNSDYLLFLDSDMVPPANAFHRLLETLERTKASMVAGHFYRRRYPFTLTWFKTVDGKNIEVSAEPEVDFAEIDSCGLACNLIDIKWVREHLEKPFFFIGEKKINGQSEFVWEDAWFCHKIKEAGGLIVGDARVRVGHMAEPLIVSDENVRELRRDFMTRHPEDAKKILENRLVK